MSYKHICTVFLLLLVGCNSSDPATSPNPAAGNQSNGAPIRVQLNWYPESEHGGVYQAAADQTYSDAALQVEIKSGGNVAAVAPQLELGRCDFGFANADDVVLARRQGMDIVAVLAAMQNSPRCILVQKASGAESFEGLAGMTLQLQPGRLFVEFMRGKGLLNGVQEVPYQGSVAPLVADRKVGVQAYSFAEPLLAQQEGVEVRVLMVSDLGWNPYSSVLITSGDMIRNDPERVRRFVQATRIGWKNYLLDPKLGNEAILAANEHGMTAEALEFGAAGLRTLALPEEMDIEQVGLMSTDRWTTLVEQMDRLDPELSGKVKPQDCFTNEFL
ncbi:MAG: ABC transporter substrate-binding protein [Rubripirellula sp.]|nr:ABC transporter substrate-binding protein [Rubripirellula sp.]